MKQSAGRGPERRQEALIYAHADKADDATRVVPMDSNDGFEERRNACRSENCLTNAYIARLREIGDIMRRGSQH